MILIHLGADIARFTGNQVISGLGNIDAADGVGVAGHERLLPAAADDPCDDARTQRIKCAEAIRWAEQAVADFACNDQELYESREHLKGKVSLYDWPPVWLV